jgi:hypothetical protein
MASRLSTRPHRTARVTAHLLTRAVVCTPQAAVASLLTLPVTLRRPRTTRPPKLLQLTLRSQHARSLTLLELRLRLA